ncbi:MAG: energy transducer TonB [Bacteroidia bacterium]
MKNHLLLSILVCFASFVFAQTDSTDGAMLGNHQVDTLFVPGIEETIFVDTEPSPLNMQDIADSIGYPMIAREANIEGLVVVRVLVDTAGQFVKQKVIKKGHPVLAEAVLKHSHRLIFSPAIEDGKKTMFWVNIPFAFRLIDGDSKKKKKRKRRN